jgi:YHS domain-containing protein
MPVCCRSRQLHSSGLSRLLRVAAVASVFAVCLSTAAQDERTKPRAEADRAAKEALAPFNDLVGGWRGVGQPRRNSRADSWQEKAEWVWEFDGGTPGVRYDVKDGKLLESALVTYDVGAKQFLLKAKLPGDEERTYSGKFAGKQLVLESEPDDGLVHRLTITPLNEKRTLVLFERRKAEQTFFTRVAEVGYTRAGTSLAVEGTDGPECIVTGGKGTIEVRFKGETYYVCCTGCKSVFDDDPEGTIAEYKQMVAERKAAREK